MFAFDEQNNNVNINLKTIYQRLNVLDGEVEDLNNHDEFLFGAETWTESIIPGQNGFLYDLYTQSGSGGGDTLFTALNYNFNANYNTVAFDDVVRAAFVSSNPFKNRIELTGKMNFSNITFNNDGIETIALKNKCNDVLNQINFVNHPNILGIDGFKSLKNFTLDGLENVKIKNCNLISNFSCVKVKNLELKNIKTDIYVDGGEFIIGQVENLNFKNVKIRGNLGGKCFNDNVNAYFNNVSFDISGIGTNAVFDNSSNLFNNFNFNNCHFGNISDSSNKNLFNGIYGLINGCDFNILNFKAHNDITLNIGKMTNSLTRTFNFNGSNSINIKDFYGHDYLFNVYGGDNVINYELGFNAHNNVSFTIDERKTSVDNVYSFKKNKFLPIMIEYGNSTRNYLTQNNNPSIYLDGVSDILRISHTGGLLIKKNTFDIYFNDNFKSENLDVKYFAKAIVPMYEDTRTSELTQMDFNTFNLHFNKNAFELSHGLQTRPLYAHLTASYTKTSIPYVESFLTGSVVKNINTESYVVDRDFYDIICKLFLATTDTFTTDTKFSTFSTFFTSSILPLRVNFYDADGHRLNLHKNN